MSLTVKVHVVQRQPPIPVLAGPTASGKTALSLELGRKYPLEVVSADAMMVYRGMDVGTAKPTPAERQGVPHHLLDILEPNTPFSVAQWVEAAESAIHGILERERIPFLVGGTGFYIRALSEGLPTTPPSDPEAIARLEVELKAQGLDAMIAELEAVSPTDAHRAERNPRRVLRAIEILRGTGKPASAFPHRPPRYSYTKIVLLPDVSGLETRIQARTHTMLKAGLIEETRALLPIFTRDGRRATSFQAIGYKQAVDHLTGVFMDDGTHRDMSLDEAERRISLATRQYAKRQMTWFRAEPDALIVPDVEAARTRLEELIQTWLSANKGEG
jgi:tRNA dimethylallyltransferase